MLTSGSSRNAPSMEGVIERSPPKHGGQVLEICGHPRTTDDGEIFISARMIDAGRSEHSDLRGETVDLYLNPTLGKQHGRELATVMAAVTRATERRAKNNGYQKHDHITFATRIEAQGQIHRESTPDGEMAFFVATKIESMESARVVNQDIVKEHAEMKRNGLGVRKQRRFNDWNER